MTSILYKQCCKCLQLLPADINFFHKQKTSKDGLRSQCKLCRQQIYLTNAKEICLKQKAYRSANKENIAQQQKQYRINNRIKHNKRNKEYDRKFPEKKKARQQRYQNKHPERIRIQRQISQKKYTENNKEKIQARKKRYKLKNLEKIRIQRNLYQTKRRAEDNNFRIMGNLRTLFNQVKRSYSKKDRRSASKHGINWTTIISSLGPCPGPKNEYHVDHIKPCCLFDHNDPEQVKQCWSPENLRWLKKEENLKKGSKFQSSNL